MTQAETIATETRPAAVQRREAILAVAHEVFLDAGYEGASMSQIAARLGGSKGTLYSYFDSKEALFEALIVETCIRKRDAMFDVPGDLGLAETLTRIAASYIAMVTSDLSTRMIQIIAAEARRWPALAALFYESGPAAAIARLSNDLEAHAAAGTIAVDDPTAAAELFLTLCRGTFHLRRMLAQVPEADAATIDAMARRAVAQFLKIYAPD